MRRLFRRGRVVMPAALAASLLLGACGGSGGSGGSGDTGADGASGAGAAKEQNGATGVAEGADVQTFVGKVTGTDAFVAVQTTGTEALVYLCDGQKIWSLFDGPLEGGSIALADPTGAKIAAALTDRTASGTVTFADGATHTFDAELASPPAGLFFDAARNGTQVTFRGWVRLDDEVRGKTVELAGAAGGDAELVGADDGGAIPPTADPEPVARRVSLLKCAAAMIDVAKAKRTAEQNPTPANLAARAAALTASAAACGNPGFGATS